MRLKKYPTSQHRYDYSIIFFFAKLIVNNIPPKLKKVTPTIPIIAGMPISYIEVVVGQSSLIRYPKISNSAEMISSSIPIIINTFFVSIFYSLSNIINILIPIKLSSCILYKMKESLFFHFLFDSHKNISAGDGI
jgi:hypothetical protein